MHLDGLTEKLKIFRGSVPESLVFEKDRISRDKSLIGFG